MLIEVVPFGIMESNIGPGFACAELNAVLFFLCKSLSIGGGRNAFVAFKEAHKILFVSDPYPLADFGQRKLRGGSQKVFGHMDALAVQVFRDGVSAAAFKKSGQIGGMVSEFLRNTGHGERGVIVELQPLHKVGDLERNFSSCCSRR